MQVVTCPAVTLARPYRHACAVVSHQTVAVRPYLPLRPSITSARPLLHRNCSRALRCSHRVVTRATLQESTVAVANTKKDAPAAEVESSEAAISAALEEEEEEGDVEFPPPLTVTQRLQRAAYFWSRCIPVFLAYKALEARIAIMELQIGPLNETYKEKMWSKQHARAADKIYDVISTLKGMFCAVKLLLTDDS